MDKKIICCVFVLLGSVFFSSCDERQTASKGNDGLITATVTGKERVVKHDPEGETYSYYLVYTDKEVFKIEDSLLFGQFDSSDVYGMLKKGKCYRIKVFGIRSGFLSSYRNIVEVEALD